jgi:hypothetical protein
MGEPFMTVYVVGQVKFTDSAAYERYAVHGAHAGEEAAVISGIARQPRAVVDFAIEQRSRSGRTPTRIMDMKITSVVPPH